MLTLCCALIGITSVDLSPIWDTALQIVHLTFPRPPKHQYLVMRDTANGASDVSQNLRAQYWHRNL